MARKPTFEDSRQKVEELEKKVTSSAQEKKALMESEEKFRSLAEQSPSMIFIGKRGRVVYANKSCEELLGYKREEICSEDFDLFKLIAPESTELVKTNFVRHMGGEEVEPYECRLTTKDGTWIDAIITTKVIDYAGEKAVLGIATDITDRKRAEVALWESERNYRTLTESSLTGIYIIQDKKFVFVNKRFADMHGNSKEEMLGREYMKFIHPGEKERIEQRISRRLRGEDVPHKYEVRLLHRDGKTLWCEIMATVVQYNGRPAIMGNLIDITERKKVEAALKAREKELQVKTGNLQELNTALKVMLNKTNEDRKELEEKVSLNMKWLVLPYLAKMKKSGLNERQENYTSIVESLLNEITSPFVRKMSSQEVNLTPTQIQVANLVKEGKTTKEIAELLNSSIRAVEFHRENLRAKFDLKNKKINLRSYLLSLS